MRYRFCYAASKIRKRYIHIHIIGIHTFRNLSMAIYIEMSIWSIMKDWKFSADTRRVGILKRASRKFHGSSSIPSRDGTELSKQSISAFPNDNVLSMLILFNMVKRLLIRDARATHTDYCKMHGEIVRLWVLHVFSSTYNIYRGNKRNEKRYKLCLMAFWGSHCSKDSSQSTTN